MRVLLANYEYPGVTENCGGGGQVTKTLKRELENRGHSVRLYTDRADKSHLTFPLRHYRGLSGVIRTYQPDVVNAHFSLPTAVTAARACQKHDIPLVTSVMGADVFDPTRYRYARPIMDLVNRYVYSRSARVLSPSLDMGRRIPRAYQSKSKVVNYGIDPDAWEWRSRELDGDARVLSVCRLVNRKNLDVAIKAVAGLRALDVDVSYTIVGTGDQEAALREKYGEHEWLTFAGYVDDLKAAYADHDVFFLPSRHEAFGMVFLEALASGLPVVTSDTGGQTDIVEDANVGVCAAPDAVAQAKALHTVLEEYGARQSATRDYVRDAFSATRMAAAYEATYRSVV